MTFLSCSQTQSSHIEVAQIVIESFYKKDNSKLKKHTTSESYESFLSIQDLMTANENGASNFTIVEETVEGDIAWVKLTTSYEEKPETFKLTLVDGQWKVTEKGLKEKAPF
jgi:hypothetical protein